MVYIINFVEIIMKLLKNMLPAGKGKTHQKGQIEFWAQLVKQQLASGIGVTEFCKQNELVGRQFSDWKYRLKKLGMLEDYNIKSPAKNEFVPVKVEEVKNIDNMDLITLEINFSTTNKLKCSFYFKEELLESVVRIFKERC